MVEDLIMSAVDFSQYQDLASLLAVRDRFDNAVPGHDDQLKGCRRWFDGAVRYVLQTAAPAADKILLEHSRVADTERPGIAGEVTLTKKVEDLLNSKFTNALKCKFSAVAFFVPGVKPAAAFSADCPRKWKTFMSGRLQTISQRLNRSQFEPPQEPNHNHLFAFSHAVLRDRVLSTPTGPISFMVDDIRKGKYKLGKQKWNVTDKAADKLRGKSVLVTGVVVTKAALVVQLTYYETAIFAPAWTLSRAASLLFRRRFTLN